MMGKKKRWGNNIQEKREERKGNNKKGKEERKGNDRKGILVSVRAEDKVKEASAA